MQPSRVRLICRSSNPFTPSVALRQHFLLPDRSFIHRQRTSYSVASEVEPKKNSFPASIDVHTPPAQDVGSNGPPATESPIPQSAPSSPSLLEDSQNVTKTLKIRRLKDMSMPDEIRDQKSTSLNTRKHGNWGPRRQDAWAEADPNSPEALLVRTQLAIDKSGDYEAVVMTPMVPKGTRPVRSQDLPWALQPVGGSKVGKGNPLNSAKAMDTLSVEMQRFHEYARPNRSEALARRHVIERVRSHVRAAMPDLVLEVFGSERTGLALALSDIDLRLLDKSTEVSEELVKPPSNKTRKRLLDDIYKLMGAFRRRKDYGYCNVLHARYPLVSMLDRASGLDVQIVCSNDTSLSRFMIQKYFQEYPFIRPVYSVIKTMFEIRGLSDTFRGGFGSYPIFMMIVASLRHSTTQQQPTNAAEALRCFLKFWSEFDTTSRGISIEPTELYDKTEEAPISGKARAKLESNVSKPPPPFCLSLRDPADETNDLGRKAIAIKHLQVTLKHLSAAFEQKLKTNDGTSVLEPLVGPVFALHMPRRKVLRNEGFAVSKSMDIRLAEKARELRESTSIKDIAAPEQAAPTRNLLSMGPESMTTESSTPSKPVVPTEHVKLDYEPHEDHGDAMASILGMPSAEAWGTESDAKAYEVKAPDSTLEPAEVKAPNTHGSQSTSSPLEMQQATEATEQQEPPKTGPEIDVLQAMENADDQMATKEEAVESIPGSDAPSTISET